MDFLDNLNPEQRDAVLHEDGALLILAGAGSGKTRVIAYRIAYLVGSGLADPSEVLAVTFTNKAAEEMRERVASLLGAASSGLWISTFHALCARLLRREAPSIGLPRDFVIYDSSDQLSAVKQVLRDLQIDESAIQPRAALSRISHAKNRMETPAAMAAKRFNFRAEQMAKVYEGYTAALKTAGALDFDDLLLKTVELFEKAEDVRPRYSTRFRFVMVDEYQDTNRPQYLLMRRFAEVHRNLAVVGRPGSVDLRVARRRHPQHPRFRARLPQRHDGAPRAELPLDAGHPRRRVGGHREQPQPQGEAALDRRRRAAISSRSRGVPTNSRKPTSSRARPGRFWPAIEQAAVAVLYRTNAQSRVIEDALRRENLPYQIVGGVRFYERKEVKDALAYLKLLLNPHDDVSLRRVINVPARGIGKGVMDALEALRDVGTGRAAGRHAGSFGAAARGPTRRRAALAVDVPQPGPRGETVSRTAPRPRLTAFRDLIVALTDMSNARARRSTIAKVLDQSGLPAGPSRRPQRRIGRARREPRRTGVGGPRVREPRARSVARRIRRSAVAALRGGRDGRRRTRADAADDDAQRQGARVPGGVHHGPRGGLVPALARHRVGRRHGGRTPPVLRGHDARAREALPDLARAGAACSASTACDRAVPFSRRGSAGTGAGRYDFRRQSSYQSRRSSRGGQRRRSRYGRRRGPQPGTAETARTGSAEPGAQARSRPAANEPPPPFAPTRTKTSPRAAAPGACGCVTPSLASARFSGWTAKVTT